MKVIGHDHKFVQLICGTSVVKKCLYQELCVLRLLKQSAPLPSLRSDKVSLLIISGGLSNRQTYFVKIGRAHSELQSRGHLVCRLLLEKKNFNYGAMYFIF